jgi:alkylhydroperoxidase/carboxymuconolactone decarboxylase family protein YurZ
VGVELDQESFARGWDRGMGTPTPPIAGAFGEFAGAIAFGDVWNRERLSDRERRLIILTVLALWGREDICSMHLGASIRKGEFDADDLDEIAITLTAYAGMPVGTAFAAMSARLRAELGDEVEGADGG